MSSTGVSILGKNGSVLEAINSSSNALSVSDSSAQGSLSTIASEITSVDNKLPAIGQNAKSASVSVTIASDQGSLAVSDSAAQSSLSTIATETTSIDNKLPAVGQNAKSASVSVTLASDQGSLDVSDSAAQGSLSTVATQVTALNGKAPSLGQAAKSASVPVVIASDQGNLAVSMGSLSANSSSAFSSQTVSNSATALSSAVDLQAVREVSVIGNCSETGAEIEILVSADDSSYFKRTDLALFSDFSSGDFGKSFMVNARYLKVKYVNDSGSSKVLSAVVVHKA